MVLVELLQERNNFRRIHEIIIGEKGKDRKAEAEETHSGKRKRIAGNPIDDRKARERKSQGGKDNPTETGAEDSRGQGVERSRSI